MCECRKNMVLVVFFLYSVVVWNCKQIGSEEWVIFLTIECTNTEKTKIQLLPLASVCTWVLRPQSAPNDLVLWWLWGVVMLNNRTLVLQDNTALEVSRRYMSYPRTKNDIWHILMGAKASIISIRRKGGMCSCPPQQPMDLHHQGAPELVRFRFRWSTGNCFRKVRPRTSIWYQLYIEATRRNLILPDLPQVSEHSGP